MQHSQVKTQTMERAAFSVMASSITNFSHLVELIIVGLFTQHLLHHHVAEAAPSAPSSFCQRTLSRPNCPFLPTYDAFDVRNYGGRWYEIGSTANFKNLQESGGICVVANYTLLQPPSPGNGAVVKVFNTAYSTGAPLHNVSQVLISITSGQICATAFSICSEIDEPNPNSSSSLFEGLVLVSNVTTKIQDDNPDAAQSLSAAKSGIENATADIRAYLDGLSMKVSRIQTLNSDLGQGIGNTSAKFSELIDVITDSNSTAKQIAGSLTEIENARLKIQSEAGKLLLKGDLGSSVNLGTAVVAILKGESTIAKKVADIEAAMATVSATAPLFLTPKSGQGGYTGSIVGTATQNASYAGKLEVGFPGFPSGTYWVLAVEPPSRRGNGGYSATLVYGCDENAGGDGIEETLFVLSRTPTLPASTVRRLLSKATALGVTTECSTPFIYTVQAPTCGNPIL